MNSFKKWLCLVGLLAGLLLFIAIVYVLSSKSRRNHARAVIRRQIGVTSELDRRDATILGALREMARATEERNAEQEKRNAEQEKRYAEQEKRYAEQAEQYAAMRDFLESLKSYYTVEAFWGRPAPKDTQTVHFLVLEASDFPDPEEAPYPSCLKMMRVSVYIDNPAVPELPKGKVVRLACWAFRNRAALPESGLEKGDIVSGTVLADTDMTDAERTLMISDTLESNQGELYYLARAAVAPRKFIPPPDVQARPMHSAVEMRERTIERIRNELTAFGGGDWNEWMRRTESFRQAMEKEKPYVVTYKDLPGNKTLARHGYHWDHALVTFAPLPPFPVLEPNEDIHNSVDGLKRVAETFEKHGIRFLYLPVPPKLSIHPDIFVSRDTIPPDGIVIPQWRKFILDLAEAGIEVVDVLPKFLEFAKENPSIRLYQFDNHMGPIAAGLAADLIAEYLPLQPLAQSNPFLKVRGTLRNTYAEWKANTGALPPVYPEGLVFTQEADAVFVDSGGDIRPQSPFIPDQVKPRILVMGDSQTGMIGTIDGMYDGEKTATIAAQLAYATQVPTCNAPVRVTFAENGLNAIPSGTFKGVEAVVLVASMQTDLFSKAPLFNIPESIF